MSDQGGDTNFDLRNRLKAQADRIEALEAALLDACDSLDGFYKTFGEEPNKPPISPSIKYWRVVARAALDKDDGK